MKAALDDSATFPGIAMETHGTGTALGDPIEVSAISAVMLDLAVCFVSGIKGNLGHTESSAGIAGVIQMARILDGNEGRQNV